MKHYTSPLIKVIDFNKILIVRPDMTKEVILYILRVNVVFSSRSIKLKIGSLIGV